MEQNLDITNQLNPTPWYFVKLRFHCRGHEVRGLFAGYTVQGIFQTPCFAEKKLTQVAWNG